ncbi:lysophospholipid acyltransferase family protein [Mycobacterium sp. IDR2000157661]|uniref:lysophospholipid acyltransferase family protein n=1 Tax=Mycobacterium sp. IDR2000157661 TaxID=2867005 RepID=UPI001EEB69C0|nr:lysophospholipid acyltransferase family protein [Mycobacterium sp. IDR2000157661]ULE33119.1 acyltransferase family protein [Mycobacterium sp. IDR2000157661]
MDDASAETRYDPSGWDPASTRKLLAAARPVGKLWFRWEVRGMETFPHTGGALAVSNHSGGILTLDTVTFSSAFYDRFGYDRPVLTLGHDALFAGPLGDWVSRIGLVPAHRAVATQALQSGAVVLVFPGGVYDAYRPTLKANEIDFNGRTGYVATAVAAGTPIVPVVSIGGQQSQLFLTRGTRLAKRLGLKRFRSDILPISVGFPFGVSAVVPVNVPLPTKIVTQVLEPIDVMAQFGRDPDIAEVDIHVRAVMQRALDELAEQRRLPVLG